MVQTDIDFIISFRILQPYYDFADDKDGGEDDYDDQGYMDYLLDREYEPATYSTKDGKDVTGVPFMQPNFEVANNDEKQIAKRSVVAATKDGVLINYEPYAAIKSKNLTHVKKSDRDPHEGKSFTALPARTSGFG